MARYQQVLTTSQYCVVGELCNEGNQLEVFFCRVIMVRRYMPTYRKSKKIGSVNVKQSENHAASGDAASNKKDKIAPSQWKEENSTRCQRFDYSTCKVCNSKC